MKGEFAIPELCLGSTLASAGMAVMQAIPPSNSVPPPFQQDAFAMLMAAGARGTSATPTPQVHGSAGEADGTAAMPSATPASSVADDALRHGSGLGGKGGVKTCRACREQLNLHVRLTAQHKRECELYKAAAASKAKKGQN
jgi:hypothetical protein